MSQDLSKRIVKVFQQFGGRASADDVWAHLRPLCTDAEREAFLRKGAITAIGSALRRKDPGTGLPYAPAVASTYVQLELLTVEDYARLITSQAKAGDRARRRVAAYQERCKSVHDVWLSEADAERIARESA